MRIDTWDFETVKFSEIESGKPVNAAFDAFRFYFVVVNNLSALRIYILEFADVSDFGENGRGLKNLTKKHFGNIKLGLTLSSFICQALYCD